jgi:hypothetical protein
VYNPYALTPADPVLLLHFKQVVMAGLEHVRHSQDSYIGKHPDWPELTWRENGLPQISEKYEGPLDYANALSPPLMFYVDSSERQRLDFFENSSFVSLVDYAQQHLRIRAYFEAASFPTLLPTAFRRLIGDVIDRYIHVNNTFDFADDKLLPIYAPIESYLLNETLHVAILVPILCVRFDSDRFEIEKNMELVKLSDRLHLARSPNLRSSFGHDPRVEAAATHAIMLVGYTIPNERQLAMWQILNRADAYPLQQIDVFFACLRLATTAPTGYAQLLALPLGWADGYNADLPPLEKAAVKNYPPWFENGYWNETIPFIDTEAFRKVTELFSRMRGVAEHNHRIKIAIRRLNLSAIRANQDDGFLDCMIGLEALLSSDSQEVTHKIATRMAALYKLEEPDRAAAVFREMKKIYSFRSKVVHGSEDLDMNATMVRGDKNVSIVDVAMKHFRFALRMLVKNPEYLEVALIDEKLLIGTAVPGNPT